MHDGWLSNTWLVGDKPGGHAVVIDTGAPLAPIVAAVEAHRLTVTHVLCTHHHYDHVAHNDDYRQRYACPVCAHPAEVPLFGDRVEQTLEDGAEISSGDLRVRALHVPGHTTGQLAFLINERRVFTGDTLFRGSVGGTRGPGHGTFDQLRHSIMEVLLRLPEETVIHPGHRGETTVARELRDNPFVRAWHQPQPSAATSRCRAMGRPAELLLRAPDYDGGTKCWVRFDDGTTDVVAGSRVTSV